jgi:pimeloyl-ACP methyl ester carboxylesterase
MMELTPFHPFRSEQAKEQFLAMYDAKAKEWPLPSESKMVETSYGQTFVRISGPAGAPPLALLPGTGGNSLMWLPNIEALSRTFRTYAIDQISEYGRSVYTREIKGADELACWLDEFFSALDLGKDIHLMGLSGGGWLAGVYVLRHPNRLRKVVLVAPAATVLPLSKQWMLRTVLCLVPIQAISDNYANWLFADLAQSDANGQQLLRDLMDGMTVAARCFKPKPMIRMTVLTDEELQGIRTPVLFIVGENERIYSPEKAVQRLKRVAPQIKTEIIPGAGHDLTFVQAGVVNNMVLDFLAQP